MENVIVQLEITTGDYLPVSINVDIDESGKCTLGEVLRTHDISGIVADFLYHNHGEKLIELAEDALTEANETRKENKMSHTGQMAFDLGVSMLEARKLTEV